MTGTTSTSPRSRRALLAGALGGLAAWAASTAARVSPAEAAAGDPIRMGRTNRAGGTGTTLQTTASEPAFRVIQKGSKGFALRAEASTTAIVAESTTNIGVHATGASVGVSARGEGGTGLLASGSAAAAEFQGEGPVRMFALQDIYRQPTTPGPAPITAARLFVRELGGGKVELCVRFPTGPIQVIATEP